LDEALAVGVVGPLSGVSLVDELLEDAAGAGVSLLSDLSAPGENEQADRLSKAAQAARAREGRAKRDMTLLGIAGNPWSCLGGAIVEPAGSIAARLTTITREQPNGKNAAVRHQPDRHHGEKVADHMPVFFTD
jgi:hypothetical protein